MFKRFNSVLNYLVGMVINQFRKRLITIAFSALAVFGFSPRQGTPPPAAQPETTPAPAQAAVLSPTPGQVLQGKTLIAIRVDVPGFAFADVSFAYAEDPTGTWFQLYESNQTPAQATVVEWDTAAITDGNYTLRLSVSLLDGGQQIIFVPGLQVRNYTPVEIATAAPPTAPTAEILPSPTATAAEAATTATSADPTAPAPTSPEPSAAAPATATPGSPRNPVELRLEQVGYGAAMGALAAAGLFALAGIYHSLKRLGKRQ